MTDLQADATTSLGPAEHILEAAQVEEMLRAVSAALRSYRLYAGQGPMLERFVQSARDRIRALWSSAPQLRLAIDEESIRYGDRKVYPSGDSGPELAFLFYKDGIREITLLPGFENELPALLAVLGRAPQIREEEDDLLTLLWQEDFAAFQYQYVEPAIEGVELADAAPPEAGRVSPATVREAAAEKPTGISPEDFRETLYFLDDAELQRLADDVAQEAARDLWGGVLGGVLDRLEDGDPERQTRILQLLGEVLASLLQRGDFGRASAVLGDLADLAGRPGVLSPGALREVRGLFAQLAGGDTVAQLVRMVEADPEVLRGPALSALFTFFPPDALAPLARASATISRPDVRRAFEGVVERLAAENRDEVIALLRDQDPIMACAAVRWAGQLGIGAALNEVVSLTKHSTATVRVAAAEALVALKAAVAGPSLEAMLEDPDREVRIGAARALAALGYAGARATLELALQSKRLRAADRSERIAFFESYGRVGGAEAVPLLDRTLNARSWLGKGESAEIRACAALGLAQVRHPTARAALASAASDADPVVRSAVGRALRGEGGEG